MANFFGAVEGAEGLLTVGAIAVIAYLIWKHAPACPYGGTWPFCNSADGTRSPFDPSVILGGIGQANAPAGTEVPITTPGGILPSPNGVSAIGTSSGNVPYTVLASGGLSLNVGGFQQVYGPGVNIAGLGTVSQLQSQGWSNADIADFISNNNVTPTSSWFGLGPTTTNVGGTTEGGNLNTGIGSSSYFG